MFQLNHLRCFVAVAEERHFRRAADRLHMTQPPLSRQIQQLEHELGVSLLDRSNRVVSLTAAGRTFLADAKEMLRLADDAKVSARRIADGAGGTLTIGFLPASSYELIPKLVRMSARFLPAVEVVLKELVTSDQLEALHAKRIDLGILRLPVDRNQIDTLCVAREAMVLAVHEDHPVALSAIVEPEALDDQPFVMYTPAESRYHYGLLSSWFDRSAVTPRFVQYARETHTIVALVGARLGMAIVPASAARLRPANVTIRSLDRADDLRSEMSFAWLKRQENALVAPFCELARRTLPTS